MWDKRITFAGHWGSRAAGQGGRSPLGLMMKILPGGTPTVRYEISSVSRLPNPAQGCTLVQQHARPQLAIDSHWAAFLKNGRLWSCYVPCS